MDYNVIGLKKLILLKAMNNRSC